jgi:hypothetical protein
LLREKRGMKKSRRAADQMALHRIGWELEVPNLYVG